MPVNIYDKKFQNWLKGVLGLNKTRVVLCEKINDGLIYFISTLSQPVKSHMQQFLYCLEDEGLSLLKPPKQIKGKNKISNYGCIHENCKILFEKFLEQHTEKGKLDLKWNVLHDRDETNRNEPTLEKEVNILWKISRLYMDAKNITKYKGLDDLDISNVIKIMRSCALFTPDGSLELYDQVLDFRNELMHSPNNEVSEDYLKEKLGRAIELIELLSTCQNQTDALKVLQKIREKNFKIYFLPEKIMADVVKAESIAVKLHTDERNKTDLQRLQEILKRIVDSEPTDIRKQLEGKASEFKELVKECMENKKKSIELDKAECSQEDSAKFESLKQKIEQDLTEINQQLKKTDEEEVADLIDILCKENETLKTEAARIKDEIKNLREANKKKEHEYFEELENYHDEQQRMKASHDILQTVNGSVQQLVDCDVAKENAALLDEIIELLERSDRTDAEVILLIGRSGAGKSALINTIHKVLTGKYVQIARQGRGHWHSVTLDLGRYENCGVMFETITDEDRRERLHGVLTKLPHIVDCPGLLDEDEPYLREILELLIGGFIPPTTNIEALWKKQKDFGVGSLKRIYGISNRAWKVTKVVFVQSCREPIPKSLIECLTGVLKLTDPATLVRKYTPEVFLLITKYDLVRDSSQRISTTTDEGSMTMEEFLKVEEEIAHEFNITGALEAHSIRWVSFADRTRIEDVHITHIALKFIKRMVEPGPQTSKPSEPVVGVMKKLTNQIKEIFF